MVWSGHVRATRAFCVRNLPDLNFHNLATLAVFMKILTTYVTLLLAVLLGGSASTHATDALPTNMVWISPGTFTMGSPETEPARDEYESPQTQVTITRGFYMGKYEVTQAEYLSVMGKNPSAFTGDLNRPVESVTWDDAVKYCAALTKRERQAGRLGDERAYRLPTEAEWEYTCRAGTTSPFSTTLNGGEVMWSRMANFNGYYEYPPCPDYPVRGDNPMYCFNATLGHFYKRTTPVGKFRPNYWGLYDMHGNVWEWCQDWIAIYPGGEATDPHGSPVGGAHVIRGGSWKEIAASTRSAKRGVFSPEGTDAPSSSIGFRVVLAELTPHEPFDIKIEVIEVIRGPESEIIEMIRVAIIGGDPHASYTIETSPDLINWGTATDLRHGGRFYYTEFVGPKPTNNVFYRVVAR